MDDVDDDGDGGGGDDNGSDNGGVMAEQDEANDERESSCDEMEETSTSWSVLEEQKTVKALEEFDKLEIDVSVQRKEATMTESEIHGQ